MVISSLAFSSSLFSSLFSLAVSFGGVFGVVSLSLPFLAIGGDFGDLMAAPVVLVVVDDGDVDGDCLGVDAFLLRLLSLGSCTSIFSGEDFTFRVGDLTGIRSSEADLLLSLSLFFVTILPSCLVFGLTSSLSTAVVGASLTDFSSIVFTALDTRGAFIAVVTSGDGVGVCVESSGDGLPSPPIVEATGFILVGVLDFEASGTAAVDDVIGGIEDCVDVTTGAMLTGSVLAEDGWIVDSTSFSTCEGVSEALSSF